jgi:hypothetical protein
MSLVRPTIASAGIPSAKRKLNAGYTTANNELSSITVRKSLVLRAFGTIYSMAVK